MARFLISTIPSIGHVKPILPIARKLVEREHEVWWYTGNGFKYDVEKTGAVYVPIRTGFDISEPKTLPKHLIQGNSSLKGLEWFKFILKHLFIDSAVSQLKDLSNILQEFPADAHLCDLLFLGAAWIHEKGGPPWAAVGTTGLPFSSSETAPFGLGIQPNASVFGNFRNRCLNWISQEVALKDVTLYLNKVRAGVALSSVDKSFFDAALSPFLHLQATVPSIEYSRSDLPSQVHFVGTLLSPNDSFTTPNWWNDLRSGKQVIYVAQEETSVKGDDIVLATIKAFADTDVLVVVKMDQKQINSLHLNSIPANVKFDNSNLSHKIMPYVNVMVTNGGYDDVYTALAYGVPLVTIGQTEDKPELCARMEWAGVSMNLKTKRLTLRQIKDAVNKVLESPQYQQKAQFFKDEIACHDAATTSVELLEELASTKQPILK
ncbi:glycosyl transferase [Calothrix sp. NIES-4071]|nr:glycosyl transferase [Calothrix sp. NIES-4071]BAZ56896.1 glycosyl transferase [Calothrix sp. NIES-4105]